MNLYSETRGQGEDIVLVHGWGMNGAVWSMFAESLAARFRVTVIELPGHGGSDYGESLHGFDEWVRACLRAAPERSVWVGWSLGGQIALRAALLAPSRVCKLVVVAGSPRFVQGSDWPMAMEERTLRLFADALHKSPSQALERFLSLQVRGDEESRQTLRRLRQDLAGRPSADPRALAQGLEFLLSVDLRSQLGAIACPLLWLLGERDTLIPVGVGEVLEGMVPGAGILILPGCSHAPFLSHPQESLETVTSFLESEDD